MKTYLTTLPNGLRTLLVDTDAFPSLTALLLVGAGSRYENDENNGIAHFFEHMAFKGSKKYPNSFVLSSVIEGLGGEFNAFTTKDHTGYYVKGPAAHVEEIVDVIADMIQTPFLLDEEIEREKGVIVQEIKMYEDTPQSKIFDLYELLTYTNSPLGMDTAGSEKTVRSFTRKTFTDYIESLYSPTNALMVVAGGLTNKTTGKTIEWYQDLISRKFSDWKAFETVSYPHYQVTQTEPAISITKKVSEQAHFCLGFRSFGRTDPQKYAASVLATILGGGMSSRLFIEVRERRGLCYSIGTYNEAYEETGSLCTYAGVSPDEAIVKQAIEVIVDQHKEIVEKGPSDEELKKAKELIKGRLILSLEDTYRVASLFGKRYLLEGALITPEEITTEIDKVTKEEVQAVAKLICRPENINFALIGPFDEKEKDFADLFSTLFART